MRIPARTISIAETATDAQLVGGAVVVLGWSWIEATGSAAAEVDLYDGTGTNGSLIVPIALNQGESTRDWLAGPALHARGGLYMDVVSGSVRGAVWVIPAVDLDPYLVEQGDAAVWSGRT